MVAAAVVLVVCLFAETSRAMADMQAIVQKETGGPETLVLGTAERPTPGAGEVRLCVCVCVFACACECVKERKRMCVRSCVFLPSPPSSNHALAHTLFAGAHQSDGICHQPRRYPAAQGHVRTSSRQHIHHWPRSKCVSEREVERSRKFKRGRERCRERERGRITMGGKMAMLMSLDAPSLIPFFVC